MINKSVDPYKKKKKYVLKNTSYKVLNFDRSANKRPV